MSHSNVVSLFPNQALPDERQEDEAPASAGLERRQLPRLETDHGIEEVEPTGPVADVINLLDDIDLAVSGRIDAVPDPVLDPTAYAEISAQSSTDDVTIARQAPIELAAKEAIIVQQQKKLVVMNMAIRDMDRDLISAQRFARMARGDAQEAQQRYEEINRDFAASNREKIHFRTEFARVEDELRLLKVDFANCNRERLELLKERPKGKENRKKSR
jgi:hypothetical protein